MDLVNIVNQFIQNTSDHDYMTEGLRVLANLTKNKEVCKYLIGKDIHQILLQKLKIENFDI